MTDLSKALAYSINNNKGVDGITYDIVQMSISSAIARTTGNIHIDRTQHSVIEKLMRESIELVYK